MWGDADDVAGTISETAAAESAASKASFMLETPLWSGTCLSSPSDGPYKPLLVSVL
jgi:hypothetical protein